MRIAVADNLEERFQEAVETWETLREVDKKDTRILIQTHSEVMIIPPDAKFKEIKNVAFASDFKNVEVTTPSVLISAVLEMFNPMLHIVNVNSEHYVSLTEEYQQGKQILKEMFKDYKNEFYFIGMNDFFDAMDNFIRDYKIDLLVTIPKHDSNSGLLFSNSHTKKLVYHSEIPILAAHE